jgi:hypothetical protein
MGVPCIDIIVSMDVNDHLVNDKRQIRKTKDIGIIIGKVAVQCHTLVGMKFVRRFFEYCLKMGDWS